MRRMLVAVVMVLFVGVLYADEVTKRTEITLNEPVMVAGVPVVTLEPGKYVIRLMRHDHNRNIVQFMNEREDHLFTTVLAINNYRLEPTPNTAFRFWETPVGNPIAIRAWFPAGDIWGQEFVYPKGLAAKIARVTAEPVPTVEAETVAELETAPITETPKEAEAIAEPEPAPPVEVAAEAAPAEVIAEAEPEPAPLPATGSPIFTFGLAGALAAGAGLMLRKAALRNS